jgi:hypothetical protein
LLIRNFVTKAVSTARDKESPLEELRGVAFYNMERDALFTALNSYEPAPQALITVPHFVTRFGEQEAPRVVLQFVYQYFKRVGSVHYDDALDVFRGPHDRIPLGSG